MLWFYLISLSTLFLAIANLLQRTLMKEEQSDPFAYAIVFQLIVASIISVGAFYKGFPLPPLQPLIPFLILMGVLYALANISFFRAFQLSEASDVSVIASSSSLFTLMVAVPFLGETLTHQKLLGTFLVILGIFLVSWKKKHFKFQKGHLFALLAAVLFGVALVNDAYLLRSFDVYSYNVVGFVLPPLIIMMLKPRSVKKIKLFLHKERLVKMLILGFLYAVAAITFGFSYQTGGEASQIGPISRSSAIITVLLAALFLKERDSLLNKVVGAISVTIGVVLLT